MLRSIAREGTGRGSLRSGEGGISSSDEMGENCDESLAPFGIDFLCLNMVSFFFGCSEFSFLSSSSELNKPRSFFTFLCDGPLSSDS